MKENRFEYFYRRYQNIRKIYSNGEVELARSEFDSFIAEISREGSAFFDLLKNTRAPKRMETNGFTSKERQRRRRSRSSE